MSAVRIFADECDSPDYNPLEQALHAWEIRRSDPKESHRIGLDLIDHALEIDDQLVTGWAYLTCGAHELAESNFEQSADSLVSAAKLFARIGEKRGESLALLLRARVKMALGEFQPALEMCKSIIEREAHGLQTLERFEAFNLIAGCFWGLDSVELSLLYLSRAFEALRNTSYNPERATVLSNMGAALLSVGNHEAAREFLVAASRFSKASEDRVLSFNIQTNLVAAHVELKDAKSALADAVNLMTDYQDLALAGPANTALCNAAMAFALARQTAMATQCLNAARALASSSDLTASKIMVAQADAMISESLGNYAVAAAQAESIFATFAADLTNEAKSQLYSLLVNCYQKISSLGDLLSVKRKRLTLSETRYQSGLAAAMVVLDLKSSLKNLAIQ